MEAGHLRPVGDAPRLAVTDGGLIRGVVVTTIAKGSSGSVSLYRNPEPIAAGSVTAYATVTARAVYAEHFTGTKVLVVKFGSQYHIVGGEC